MNTDEIIAKGIKASTAKGRGLYSLIPTIMLIMTVSLLVACGGSSGGSSGPATSESVVARGVITQLGSIWVNGVEYETPDGGLYSDDDSTSTTASYQVGQVVSLRGRRNDDGVSGTADEVEYEAEIEGAAGADNTINGVTILIDNNTNITRAPSISASALLLDIDQRYEVSGFRVSDFIIQATFIKHDDDLGPSGDGIDEVKGPVDTVDATSITVHGVKYLSPDAAAFSRGDIVEVHFNPASCTGSIPNRICNADIVELEDDFNDEVEGLEAEFEGAVNMDPTDLAACPTGAKFLIGPTCIDWDSVPPNGWMDGLVDSDDMVPGLRVEAEGHFNSDGLLIAEKIKGRGNRVRITAVASSVGPETFEVFGGTIQVTYQSGLTDSSDASITDGAGLEIRGIRTGPTSVLALRIKDDSVNSTSIHVLRAKVDENGADPNPSAQTITVMGVTSDADGSTQLEIEDVPYLLGIVKFLTSIDDDNIVNSTNGARDVVDVRIDLTKAGSIYYAKQIEIEREDD